MLSDWSQVKFNTLHEHGERAGRFLSHQLRQYSAAKVITDILTVDGEVKSDPKDINDQFKLFYSSLYSSDNIQEMFFLKYVLENITLLTIADEDRPIHEQQISEAEIRQAIKQ